VKDSTIPKLLRKVDSIPTVGKIIKDNPRLIRKPIPTLDVVSIKLVHFVCFIFFLSDLTHVAEDSISMLL